MDLFEHYEKLPAKMLILLDEFSEKETSYENCKILLEKCKKLGYNFEYGLDCQPYNLIKI